MSGPRWKPLRHNPVAGLLDDRGKPKRMSNRLEKSRAIACSQSRRSTRLSHAPGQVLAGCGARRRAYRRGDRGPPRVSDARRWADARGYAARDGRDEERLLIPLRRSGAGLFCARLSADRNLHPQIRARHIAPRGWLETDRRARRRIMGACPATALATRAFGRRQPSAEQPQLFELHDGMTLPALALAAVLASASAMAQPAQSDICTPGYAREHRMPAAEAHAIKLEMMRREHPGEPLSASILDHRTPLCLGGANDRRQFAATAG
jgi:hypothetical protein